MRDGGGLELVVFQMHSSPFANFLMGGGSFAKSSNNYRKELLFIIECFPLF